MDLSPYLWLDSASTKSDSYTPTVQELYDWYDRPSFTNLYLDLQDTHYRIFMQIDLRPDLKADLDHFTFTNLPLPIGGSLFIDPNFPQVGYGEYRSASFNLSLGRRKIDWGPGYYDVGISDRGPYFDHLAFDFTGNASASRWKYNFLAVTTDTRGTYNSAVTDPNQSYKTFIAHKLSYYFPSVIVTATDYNLIYRRVPDLQEIAPFIHYHGLYQRDQNVALGFSADALLNNDLRMYGEFFLDDFQTAIESGESNPGAMGAVFGIQYRLSGGKPFSSLFEDADKHTLKNKDFTLRGGLVMRWENVWTSEYLYGREDSLGTMTNPIYYMWEYHPKIVESFFGAAFGPDMLVERLSLTHDTEPVKLETVLEYHLTGGHGITGVYAPPYDNWLTLGSPVSHQSRFSLNASWKYRENRELFADVKVDFGENFRIQGGAGWGMKLF